MRIKRILLGLGGTDFTPVAIKYAVELAKRHEAEVTGVTVVDERLLRDVGPVPAGGGHMAQLLREHRLEVTRQRVQDAVEAFSECCEAEQLSYRVHQEHGEAFALMTGLARYHDTMIFGLKSVFDYGLSIDPEDAVTRLVHAGVRPLIAVAREHREIQRVLLAYSGSPESAKAIKRFLQSGLWPGIELRLLTCGAPSVETETMLRDMAGYCRAHGYEPELEQREGSPGPQIVAAAEEWNADMIVLGNGIRTLWLRRILGSTALHVVQHANRPLYLSQ